MKALLTSAGIANNLIENEMWRLLGGKREGLKMLFCPTASNYEGGNMNSWVIDDLEYFKRNGFEIDICDIAGAPDGFVKRFEWADVFFFEGGSTGWLKRQITDSGLEKELPRLLETRVWIGSSAGSIVLCPTSCNTVQDLFDEDDLTPAGTPLGLNLVDFDFVPHLNNEMFPKVRADKILVAARKLQKNNSKKLYAVDDEGAVSVDGDEVRVVSAGEVVEKDYSML